jgi:predicted DsbA family dithiol-disulfide isomerase
VSAVEAFYYTDPICAWSWAAEPARLRAERAFASELSLTYVMGGLAREFGPPLQAMRAWLDAAAATGMPVDPRLWLDAPPRGSFAACIAVIAAGEQGLAGAYLRRAREAVAQQRRPLDDAPVLLHVAREVAGLDVARFQLGLGSHAVLETFGAELARTRAGGEDGLPRLELVAGDGTPALLHGAALLDPRAWTDALLACGAQPAPDPAPSIEQALCEHGRLATPELAALCDLPGPAASMELWRLATEWRVRAERRLGGEVWSLA